MEVVRVEDDRDVFDDGVDHLGGRPAGGYRVEQPASPPEHWTTFLVSGELEAFLDLAKRASVGEMDLAEGFTGPDEVAVGVRESGKDQTSF